MSTTMNSRSITDYILKLEKDNSELDLLFKESRTTIKKLERRLDKAHQAKVDALNDLNDLKCENRIRKEKEEKEEKEAIGKLLDRHPSCRNRMSSPPIPEGARRYKRSRGSCSMGSYHKPGRSSPCNWIR